MHRWFACACALVLVALGWARCTISQRLVLPDGKPAAGAAVTVRLARPERRAFEELRAVADARGVFAVAGEVDTGGLADLRAGYLLVDAPGCVLTVAALPVLRANESPRTLRLDPDCPYTGKVVDEAGHPVAGAAISVMQLGGTVSWGTTTAVLNAPNMGVATPALTAKTRATGAFTLRGATLVSEEHGGTAGTGAFTPGKLVAYAQTPAGLLAGETDMLFRPAGLPAGNPPKAVVVAPTLVVRGTVLNSVTNAPVANARITFDGESVAAAVLPPATTDARGGFEYVGVPRLANIYALAAHPATSGGWAVVTGRLRSAAERAQLVRQVVIKVKPLAPVTAVLVDAATGHPLPVPATLIAVADEGVRVGGDLVGRDTARGAVVNGAVAMQMAAGRNRLELAAPGYALAEESAELFVAPAGVRNLTCKAVRQRGFLVTFTTRHPDGFFGTKLQVRTADGQVRTAGGVLAIRPDGWWFAPVGDLGETVEMRVLRDGRDILPWTRISADPGPPPAAMRLD